jgi:hypothetical protein
LRGDGKRTMTVTGPLSGEGGKRAMMIEGRVLKPDDHIHDLLDPLDEANGFPAAGPAGGKPGPEGIYDLVDVVEKKPKMAFVDTGLRDEIMKRAAEIAEKVARELVPDIAERVIREEIEKLKKDA